MYGNYPSNLSSPDFSDHRGKVVEGTPLFEEYLKVIEYNDPEVFFNFIKRVIVEQLYGEEGTYWIGGYRKDYYGRGCGFLNVPVLKVVVSKDDEYVAGRRRPRVVWGKRKKSSYKYDALNQIKDLDGWVN